MTDPSLTVSLAQSVVLGVVEGLTEFLPVSSTGHLTIAENLMNIDTQARSVTGFTAVIQMGAIVASIVYFRADIVRIVAGWGRGLVNAEARTQYDSRLGWYVIAGTIPIGIVGLAGKNVIKDDLRYLWVVAVGLIVWSGAMIFAEKKARQDRGEQDVTFKDILVMGLFQCIALVPGVSRSGATISAGLLRGLDRVTATRLSFFLGIPALLAAGIFELKDAFKAPAGPVVVGTIVSFVVAYVAIAWLLKFVASHSIAKFVPYRLVVGALILIGLATNVLGGS
ncbi:MAG: undecaprenyl-diphosphatase [Frankiales bacterium]|nr:undecaprenyl-diphosphatase [Frankiales bacterium]